MTRLLTLLSLAAMLCMVVSQSGSSASSVPLAATVTPSLAATVTPSKAVVSSTTSMAKSSSMAPSSSVTPQPTPIPEPTDNNYFLNNSKTVCLRMKAGLSFEFTYFTDHEKDPATRYVDLLKSAHTIHPDSYCNATQRTAVLKLEYAPKDGDMDPYFVTFHFDGTSSVWNASTIHFEFTFNATNLPGYNGTSPTSTNVSSNSTDRLFDGGDVGLKNSFSCDVNRTIRFNPIKGTSVNVSLFMMDFQVQAFNFSNATSGQFDSGVVCSEANTGNKIVPIAVGAALAGLVIVVLVAYLIGRLRNRKKSSYEALS